VPRLLAQVMLSILVLSCDRTRACGFAYACMHTTVGIRKRSGGACLGVFAVGDIRALEIPRVVCFLTDGFYKLAILKRLHHSIVAISWTHFF
jgi:hypothetical protein